MSKIQKIYNFCKEINKNPSHPVRAKYGVKAASIGDKQKNGISTGKMSIILHVSEKKNIDLLSKEEIIPDTLNADGVDIVTDVTIIEKSFTLDQTKYCHAENPEVDPVMQHRKKQRPLKGGISSITGGMVSAGGANRGFTDATLGIIVRDKTDGQIVLLSNNHVYGDSTAMPSVGSLGSKWRRIQSPSDPTSNKVLNDVRILKAVQPGNKHYEFDSHGFGHYLHHNHGDKVYNGNPINPYGSYALSSNAPETSQDIVGSTKRTVLFGDIVPYLDLKGLGYPAGSVDAGIVELSGYDLIDPIESNQILNFTEPGPYQFATEEEIFSLFDETSINYQAPVFRAGRTLGPLGDEGSSIGSCTLSGNGQLSAASYGPSLVGTGTGTYHFPECIHVKGDGSINAAQGGDSGTAVFAQLSSTVPSASAWKCIGLLFAGPRDLTAAICSPIHLIQEKLNIVPWDGSIPQLSSTTETLTVFDSNIYESNKDSFCFNYKLSHKGQEYAMTNWILGNTDKVNDSDFDNSLKRMKVRPYYLASNNKGDIAVNSTSHRYVDRNATDTYTTGLRAGGAYYTQSGNTVLLKSDDYKITPHRVIETPWLTGGIPRREDIVSHTYGNWFLYNDQPFTFTHRPSSYLQTVKDGVFNRDSYLFWLNDRADPSNKMVVESSGNWKGKIRVSVTGNVQKENQRKFYNLLQKEFENEPPVGVPANDHIVQIYKHHGEDGMLNETFGSPSFTENGDLIKPYMCLYYTNMANASGYSATVTDQFSPIPGTKLTNKKRIYSVPEYDFINPLVSEGIKEYGQGKLVIFDPKNDYSIKQVLNPIDKNLIGNDNFGLLSKYKAPDGNIHEFVENFDYGASSFNVANETNTGGMISTYGDYLAVTAPYMSYTSVSGYQREYIDIYKLDHDTDLWEPLQTLSGSWPIDYAPRYTGDLRPNRSAHIEMNDKYIVTYGSVGHGLYGLGSPKIYEKGDDGLFTYKYQLSSPIAGDEYFTLNDTLCAYNDRWIHYGVLSFGRYPVFLGKYLFVNCDLWDDISQKAGLAVSGTNEDYNDQPYSPTFNPQVQYCRRPTFMLDSSNDFTLSRILSSDQFKANDERFFNDIFINVESQPANTFLRRMGTKDKMIRVTGGATIARNLKEGEDLTTSEGYGNLFYEYLRSPVRRMFDLIELIDDVPTITKRMVLDRYTYYPDFVGWLNTDFKKTILGNAWPFYMSHDNDYLYSYDGLPRGWVAGDDITPENDKVMHNIVNYALYRVRLDDETYFKPMTEYGYDGPIKLLPNQPSLPTICDDKLGVDRNDDISLDKLYKKIYWYSNNNGYKKYGNKVRADIESIRKAGYIWGRGF